MVGIGLVMIAAGLVGVLLWWRARLFETRWYLAVVSRGWWIGFVAVIAGWIVTESGRQPWLVTGILRTADSTSPVPAASIAVSLALFLVVYAIVFTMGIYYINRLIEHGPQGRAVEPPSTGLPGRPLSAAADAAREIFTASGRART